VEQLAVPLSVCMGEWMIEPFTSPRLAELPLLTCLLAGIELVTTTT
jgi:hypothetical protein